MNAAIGAGEDNVGGGGGGGSATIIVKFAEGLDGDIKAVKGLAITLDRNSGTKSKAVD